jgi:signal transduction histidine kinase
VIRLNRVVNDVLDFARPIRFDYAPADVNALCAVAEQATRTGYHGMRVMMTPDPLLGTVVTDAERLRTALVNILANARHAVTARSSSPEPAAQPAGSPEIEIETHRTQEGFRIIVRDRGTGVKSEDLPRVFDPYFTTKRTGSGLGLAIAKNIIDGMAGSIAIESRSDGGTEIRIDLPLHEERAVPATAQGGRA